MQIDFQEDTQSDLALDFQPEPELDIQPQSAPSSFSADAAAFLSGMTPSGILRNLAPIVNVPWAASRAIFGQSAGPAPAQPGRAMLPITSEGIKAGFRSATGSEAPPLIPEVAEFGANMLTTPEGVVGLPLVALRAPKVAQTALAAFSGEAAAHLPAALSDLGSQWDTMTPAQRSQALVNITGQSAFAVMPLAYRPFADVIGEIRDMTAAPTIPPPSPDLIARNIAAPGTVRQAEIRGTVAPAAEAPADLVVVSPEAFKRRGLFAGEPLAGPNLRMMEPPETVPMPPKVAAETRGKVSFGAEAPTLATQPLPKRTLAALEREKAAEAARAAAAVDAILNPEVPNALQVRQAAPILRDVPQQPVVGEGQVPTQESIAGVPQRNVPQETPGTGQVPVVEGQQPAPKPMIVAAAFRDNATGTVFNTGPIHQWVEGMPKDQKGINSLEQGFITRDGKFVNRQQAEDLTGEIPFAEMMSFNEGRQFKKPEAKPLEFPKPPKPLPSAKGLSEAQKEAAFKDHIEQVARYESELKAWEAAYPQNKPMLFKKPNGGYGLITKDASGNWRATDFSQIEKGSPDVAPFGHALYKTRFDALRDYRNYELTDTLPNVLTEAELKARTAPKPPEAATAATVEAPKTGTEKPKRTPPPQPERGWDLIDQIEADFGTIDPRLIREANPDWKPVGAARKIFRRGGTNADKVATALSEQGLYKGDPGQVDQLGEAINAAAQKRKGDRETFWRERRMMKEDEKALVDFTEDALKGARPEGSQTVNVSVSAMVIGDTFEVRGQKFTVKDMLTDDDGNVISVELKDGPKYGTQRVDGDTIIRIDPETLKSKEVQFLEPADDPFALDKPETPEEAKAREAAQAEEAQRKAQRQDIQDRAQEPIVGRSVDTTGDFFEENLFNRPPKQERPPSESAGPGAASPLEFAERSVDAAREVMSGNKEPGNSPPVEVPPSGVATASDVTRANRDYTWNQGINSPQWVFWFGKLGEAAKNAWETMALAEFALRESVGRDIKNVVVKSLHSIPWRLRKNGGQALFEALDGKNLTDITRDWQNKPGGAEIIAVATEIKGFLENIRVNIRDTKRDSYRKALMSMNKQTLQNLWQKNIGTQVNIANYTKDSLADGLMMQAFPDDWGIADGSYMPHIFQGRWKVYVDAPNGSQFVLSGQTLHEAKAKVYELTQNNPQLQNAGFKYVEETLIPADMVRVGDAKFWRLIKQMKDQMGVTPSEARLAAQGVVGRQASKQKWFGSLLKRLGAKNYESNFKTVMTAYLHGYHRWRILSDANNKVMPLIEQIRREGRGQAADQLEMLFDNLWGKPASSTIQFDNLIRRIPGARDWIKPLALERWTRNARGMAAFLALTNIKYFTLNRLQPLQGLYPMVGERLMLEAKALQHSAQGRQLLEQAGIEYHGGQYSSTSVIKGMSDKMRERVSGEKSNKEVAFLALYLHGKKLGMSDAQAMNYGKLRGELMTQFVPLIVDTPAAMRGPVLSTIFQYKRFPIKQAELMVKEARRGNIPGVARWLVVMAALGGVGYYLRQTLQSGETKKKVQDALKEKFGETTAEALYYGIPGYLGADMSGSIAIGEPPIGDTTYEKIGRFATGPAVGMVYDPLRTVLTEKRQPLDLGQTATDITRRYPSLKPVAELIAILNGDEDVRTASGETKLRRSLWDAMMMMGSFRTTSESDIQIAMDAMVENSKQRADILNAIYVASESSPDAMDAAYERMDRYNDAWPEMAISNREVNTYIKRRRSKADETQAERMAGKRYQDWVPQD